MGTFDFSDALLIEGVAAGCKTLADDTLRLQVDIPPHLAEAAFKAAGRRGANLVLVFLRDGHARVPEGNGTFWQQLIASGFFRAPKVCRAIQPETVFENWLRSQRAVLGQDDYNEAGEIQNEVAHVRRVHEGAGTAEKPPYFAVPLSAAVHAEQHQHGELWVLRKYRPDLGISGVGQAKAWFEKKADGFRTEWASLALANLIRPGCKSRAEVGREEVWNWVCENGLQNYWTLKDD